MNPKNIKQIGDTVLAMVFVVGVAYADDAASKPAPTVDHPMIYKVQVADKDVPYAKVYGDIDRGPTPSIEAVAKFPAGLPAGVTSGAAIVRFTINKDGKPQDIVVTSASQTAFGPEAAAAVARNHYQAAKKNKKPASCTMEMIFIFPGPFAGEPGKN